MYDLVMAALPGGRARNVEGWRSFKMGGLKLVNIHPLRASTGQGGPGRCSHLVSLKKLKGNVVATTIE